MERLIFKRSFLKIKVNILLALLLILGISYAQEEADIHVVEAGNLKVLSGDKRISYRVFSTIRAERDQMILLKVDIKKVKEEKLKETYSEPIVENMEFEGVPLEVFLKAMGRILGRNIVVDISAQKYLDRNLNVLINQPKRAEDLFRDVLNAYNLDYYKKSSGEIVIREANLFKEKVGEIAVVDGEKEKVYSVVAVYEALNEEFPKQKLNEFEGGKNQKLSLKEVMLLLKAEKPIENKNRKFFIKRVSLEGVTLEVLIKSISKVAGRSFVIEPSVPLHIETNVNLEGSFSPEDLLNTVFDAYDIIAVPKGDVVVISSAYKVILDISEIPETNLEKLIDVINKSVSPGARVLVDKGAGLIIIKDSVGRKEILDNLKTRLSRLIKGGVNISDTSTKYDEVVKTEAFFIKEAYNASDVRSLIESKLEDYIRDKVNISTSREFNAVIVTAPKKVMDSIKELISPYVKSGITNLKITKTFYVKFISAENFKELIEPLLSPEGEVFILSSGLPPTTAYEKELRMINARIEELEDRLRAEEDEKVRASLQNQLQNLRSRKDQLMQKLEQLKGIGLTGGRGGGGATTSISTPTTEASLNLATGDRITKSRRTAISVLNAVVVRDYAHIVERIRNTYKDIISEAPIQIKIEARIVEIDKEYLKTLGINWSALLSNAKVPESWSSFVGANPDLGGPTLTPTLLGEPNTGGILTLVYRRGILNALNLRLSAFERIRKAKSLAKPVVLTLNGEPAVIESTIEYPVVQVSSTQTALTVSAEYKEIPLKLLILPTLAPDGRIVLDISLIKTNIIDQISYDVGAGVLQQFPIYSTKQIDTKVIVDDGDTVVIGGIVASDKLKTDSGVPGFKRIPLLGWLFKEKTEQISDKELLIFITPTVLHDM